MNVVSASKAKELQRVVRLRARVFGLKASKINSEQRREKNEKKNEISLRNKRGFYRVLKTEKNNYHHER